MCLYCNKVFKGGGTNLFKKHLARIRGETESCKKVLADVRFQMLQTVEGHVVKKRKSQQEYEKRNQYGLGLKDQ